MSRESIVRARPPLLLIRKENGQKLDYDKVKAEYQSMYDSGNVDDDRREAAESQVDRMVSGRVRYQAVGEPLGIPWSFIAAIHALEASFNFSTHLHNGDPLTAPTKQVPAGRPPGPGPFTWEESATDALTLKGYQGQSDWSDTRQLYRLECYNGTGYRLKERPPTPYLWAGSNHERAGKFVADGSYDPTAVSQQIGAAVLLKLLSLRLMNEAAAPVAPAPTPAVATVAPRSLPTPNGVLRLTDPLTRGPEVATLQTALRGKGIEVATDSIFGEDTERAVKAFQAKAKLDIDGIAGPSTLAALGITPV